VTFASGFAGDGGPATASLLSSPKDVAVTPTGDLLVVDSGNNRVRLVNNTASPPSISTWVGRGVATGLGAGSHRSEAFLNSPSGVTVDGAGGIVYIAEEAGNVVRGFPL
jgi:DNA-binding beta-propeller fold protein YncE